jgi:hypothetical protein
MIFTMVRYSPWAVGYIVPVLSGVQSVGVCFFFSSFSLLFPFPLCRNFFLASYEAWQVHHINKKKRSHVCVAEGGRR